MQEVFQVKKRESTGSRHARKLRKEHMIPAVLYGHGEANILLTVPADDVAAALRHGNRVVNLKGDLNESALISEIQWDAFGADVLHVDLTRVSAGERVDIECAVETRGAAPGVSEGGVLSVLVHSVEISAPVMSVPEKLEMNINELHLDQQLLASDLDLPEGVELITPADTPIVSCMTAQEEVEEEEGGGPEEPEVIRREGSDEEGED